MRLCVRCCFRSRRRDSFAAFLLMLVAYLVLTYTVSSNAPRRSGQLSRNGVSAARQPARRDKLSTAHPFAGNSSRGGTTVAASGVASDPSKDYPTKDDPPEDYPFKDYPPKDYPSKDYPPKDYPSKDYPAKDYPVTAVPGGGESGTSRSDGGARSTAAVDVEAEVNPVDLFRFLQTDDVLLAGVPRPRRVEFTIGMVTVSRDKGNYFFDTLASLLTKSTASDRRELTIVVMLADRNQSHNANVLRDVQRKHSEELQMGLLLVIRMPNTDFLFQDKSVKRTYNDSLMRVQWRSKQNLDYAALIEFCANLSTYYLHLEDDVIAADAYLRHIRDFISANALKTWAMLEVCPHGFIGKLFKTKDLPKLVMILRAFYLEQPCDFLIKPYFINLMTQAKPIVRRPSLFFHKGRFSSLKYVTRKVDREPSRAGQSKALTVMKVTRTHRNPPATLFTSMSVYSTNVAANAYEPQNTKFFWAKDVKEGQYVSVVFDAPQRLSKLIVETGFSDKERRDMLQRGSVEVGNDVPTSLGTTRCPNTQKTGEFTNGRFEAAMTSKGDIRCISIVIDKNQTEWLVIRDILVFV